MGKDVKREKLKKELSAPTRRIDYQVDTLQTLKFAAAEFSPDENTITVNYVKSKDNSFNESRSVIAHEQKHRDNHKAGMKNLPMSLEQYYKVRCHNEISATMCELLQLRQEYIDAPTEKVRKKIMEDNLKFDYYFEAVKQGKINPLSSKSADFEKEMRFIATETQKMWMESYALAYDGKHTSSADDFFSEHRYDELQPNNANYAKARKIAYTIGGIDFSKYIGDIECINPNIKEADTKIKNNESRKNVKTSIKKAEDKMAEEMEKWVSYIDSSCSVLDFENIEFKPIEGLSPSQQYRLAQHRLFVANVVNQRPSHFDDDIRDTINKGKMKNYDEVVEDAFKNIQDIQKNYPQFQAQWKKAEQQFAAQIAEDNASTVFLESGDNKKYQEELAKIYTVNGINLQKYYKDVEKLIPNNVPTNIKAVENSSWYTRLGNKCNKKNFNKFREEFRNTVTSLIPIPWMTKHYTGKPKYPEWSPDKRVSPVKYATIYDFTKPFLKQEQEQRTLAEAKTKAVVSNAKLAQRTSRKPDKVLGKKNPAVNTPAAKKKAPVKKAEFHRKSDGDWLDAAWQKLKSFTR
ncbi:MAG: hypothetical protein J6J35_06905 [Alphaproteobacteria bacterium]|nr:hypothetical protein [Alphaproteobacteria bacterium]